MSIADKLTEIAENVPKVFDAGKKEEHKEFWKLFQYEGREHDIRYKYYNWTKDMYKPIYDHVAKSSGASSMFQNATTITDIQTNIDVSKGGACTSIFAYCFTLETIPLLKVCKANNLSNAFLRCEALKEVNIEGEIGSAIDLQSSKLLSKTSITSFINALSTTASGLSITFSSIAVNKAFETSENSNDGSASTEWANLIATKSNWTIALVGGIL